MSQWFSFLSYFSQFLLVLSSHSNLKSFILLSLLFLSIFLLFHVSLHCFLFVNSLEFFLLMIEMIVILSVNVIFLSFQLISLWKNLVILAFLINLLLSFSLTSLLFLSDFLLSLSFLLLKNLSFSLSFISLGLLIHIDHSELLLLLSLFLLLFHSFSWFNYGLVLMTQWMFNMTFFKFIVKHLLFEKLVIFKNLFVLLSFLMKFAFLFKKFFKLSIFKIRSGNFVVQNTNLYIILSDIFLKDIHLLIDHFQRTLSQKLRVFRIYLSRPFRILKCIGFLSIRRWWLVIRR